MERNRLEDMTGKIFGRWTVLSHHIDKIRPRQTLWKCVCQCGKEKVVHAESLKKGISKSCGCLRSEMWRKRSGRLSPRWKGGVMRLPSGYVKILGKTHANADYNGYVFEHVLAMSKHLGRPLKEEERVHHKDGDRSNNDLSNLELWYVGHPYGQRVNDLIGFAWKIISQYDPQHKRDPLPRRARSPRL